MDTFEVIALTLLGLTTLYYFFFLTRVQLGITRLFHRSSFQRFPYVSVVIAARNEEKNIEACLQSVLAQQYPSDRFEVIVVDDHSSDNTARCVRSLQKNHSNLKLFSLPEGKSGKILALQMGIEEAKGEFIATTDADCRVTPLWILTLLSHATENTAMIAGPVLIQTAESSLWSRFDQLELLGLVTVAAGLIGAARPIICNGANLAYRRETFFRSGGFKNAPSNNDDEYLMSRFVTQNLGTVQFAWEPSAVVRTQGTSSFRSFIRQRLRWAGKKGHYEDFSILIELVVLYFFSVALLVTLMLGIFVDSLFLLPTVVAWLGKILLDYFTIRIGGKLWNEKVPVGTFLLAELFHVPYIFITAFLAQFFSLRWKGRTLSS